jgi:carbamoyltransferase
VAADVVILGVWDGHDAGAALVVDGRLVSAINEERLTRRKLEIVFPSLSIAACLAAAGLRPADVTVVAASTSDPAKTLGRLIPWTKERYYQVRRRKAAPGLLAGVTHGLKRRMTEWKPNALTRSVSAMALRRACAHAGLAGATLRLFDHHDCHARGAAYASGFPECAVVTIDGLGDGVSASIRDYAAGRLRLVAESRARDSLGVFFEHVTHLLNMRELEDEGKVMALADYAAPVPDDRNPLLAMFTVRDGVLRTRFAAHAWAGELRRLLWSTPNEQFAFLAQRAVERVSLDLVRAALALTGRRRVALAGGVVSNVKANRLIRLLPELDDVYVFPHMGDGGLPLGAALAAAAGEGAAPRCDLGALALGPSYGDDAIRAVLDATGLRVARPANLAAEVSDRLVDGQIVCWFQGGMEYGPRALGQRSVLARPDRLDLKDRLNLILKRRVWYQPFCPSLLEREAARVFADWTPSGRRNRAMTMAYLVAPEWRSALTGVINVDGSCRPQLVADDDSGPFAAVLRGVGDRLGVAAVLNTSFNIHGEPLVCTPADALDVFRRGGADALAIGGYLVEAPAASAPDGSRARP